MMFLFQMKWNILRYLQFQNKLTFAITLYCRNMLRNFLRQQCTHETWIWFGHWIVRERVRTNLQFYILKPCFNELHQRSNIKFKFRFRILWKQDVFNWPEGQPLNLTCLVQRRYKKEVSSDQPQSIRSDIGKNTSQVVLSIISRSITIIFLLLISISYCTIYLIFSIQSFELYRSRLN